MLKFNALLRGFLASDCWVVMTTVLTLSCSALAHAAPPVWQEIKPGGGSICARGGEFSFFVSHGRPDKVVIDFIGGGACWNAVTCAKETATFTDSVDDLRRRSEEGLQGIYAKDQHGNPLKDWTHVVIPYCTGDVHWGDQTVRYRKLNGKSFKIHHKGAVNTKAVLGWLSQHYAQAARVLVTGCSAGAYGSIYWTPAIRRLFPDSALRQLADSGAGVVTPAFFSQSFPLWNPTKEAPRWIPALDPARVDWSKLSLVDLYRSVGSYYPEISLAQYNSAFDATQTFFYEIMGGYSEHWSPSMYESIAKISSELPTFSSYTAPGEDHCILPYKRFYSQSSQGVRFRDWFAAYLDGQDPPSVPCDQCPPPR